MVRIDVLEEEVEYYKTLIRPTDTGHVHTAINFIQDRIRILKGRKRMALPIISYTTPTEEFKNEGMSNPILLDLVVHYKGYPNANAEYRNKRKTCKSYLIKHAHWSLLKW